MPKDLNAEQGSPEEKRKKRLAKALTDIQLFQKNSELQNWCDVLLKLDNFLYGLSKMPTIKEKRKAVENKELLKTLYTDISSLFENIGKSKDKKDELKKLVQLLGLVLTSFNNVPRESQQSIADVKKKFKLLGDSITKKIEESEARDKKHEQYKSGMAADFSNYLFELADKFIDGGAVKIRVSYNYRRDTDNELMVTFGEKISKDKGGSLFTQGNIVSLNSVSFYAKEGAKFGKMEYAHLKDFFEIVAKVFKEQKELNEQEGANMDFSLKLKAGLSGEKADAFYKSLIFSKDNLHINTHGTTSIFVYDCNTPLLYLNLDDQHTCKYISLVFYLGHKLEPIKSYVDTTLSFFKGEAALPHGSVHDSAVSLHFHVPRKR